MNLVSFFSRLFDFGTRVETVTAEDVDARLNTDQAQAAQIIKQGIGYSPAPPGAYVVDNTGLIRSPEPDTLKVAQWSGFTVAGDQIYDAQGRVPADEWAWLNAQGDKYLRSVAPMPRDPSTGRPVRD